MRKEWLQPEGVSQKSFYRKAYIIRRNEGIYLFSYNTLVAAYKSNFETYEDRDNFLRFIEERYPSYFFNYKRDNEEYSLQEFINYPFGNIIIFNLQSNTTVRHVYSFAQQFGDTKLNKCSKKELKKNYLCNIHIS